jgi:hypothetical protein
MVMSDNIGCYNGLSCYIAEPRAIMAQIYYPNTIGPQQTGKPTRRGPA